MSAPIFVLAAGGAAALLAVAAFLWSRSRDRPLRRRLRRIAEPALYREESGAAAVEANIFRRAERGARFAWLWRPVENRFPLLDAGWALPRAIGLGFAGAAGFWFAMWFLKIPSGWWTMPLVGLAGAGSVWYALSWFHDRRETEFARQFPEVIDQIVRLSGAGVPTLEAISLVAEDAQPPVQPVLRSVSDALIAGLDADKALRLVSARVRLAEFAMFSAVIRLQQRSGGGVSAAFANLARALRERRATVLKARASTAQTRLTLLVLTLMPVAVLLAQKFISPQSVDILFDPERGTGLLHWGVGLVIAGLLGARAIAARAEQK